METTWNFKPMMLLENWRVQYAGYSLLCDNQHVLVLGLGLELILLDDTCVCIRVKTFETTRIWKKTNEMITVHMESFQPGNVQNKFFHPQNAST